MRVPTGENPATEAGFRGPEIVKLFLDQGVDPNAVSTAGHTMLMNAIYVSNLSIMKLLINAGAEVTLANKPLITAISNGSFFTLLTWPFLAAAESAEAGMNAGNEALLIGDALKKAGQQFALAVRQRCAQ